MKSFKRALFVTVLVLIALTVGYFVYVGSLI